MTRINSTAKLLGFLIVASLALPSLGWAQTCRGDRDCPAGSSCNRPFGERYGVCEARGPQGEEGDLCAGVGGFTCNAGLECVFDPLDPCVASGGVDCAGTCQVPDEPDDPWGGEEGDMCGGIAGIPCNAGLECVFPPSCADIIDCAGTCQVPDEPDTCVDDDPPFTEASVKWQSVGSTGAVDESSLDIFKFFGTTARVADGATGNVHVRYDINCVPDFHTRWDAGLTRLEARFKDDGDAAHVRVRLRRIHFETGVVETLYEFDSDTRCPSDSFQTFSGDLYDALGGYLDPNCNEHAYFIAVQLSKTGNGDPGLGILRLRGY
jgi:hypothetical protein